MIQQSVSVMSVAEQIYFSLRQLPSSSVWDAGDFTHSRRKSADLARQKFKFSN